MRSAAAITLLLFVVGCAYVNSTHDYPESWPPLAPLAANCRSLAGCYQPRMQLAQASHGEGKSPYGERDLTFIALQQASDDIDTNRIEPVDAARVCVTLPDERTIAFQILGQSPTPDVVFGADNGTVTCREGRLTISKTLYFRSFMYWMYIVYTKSLILSKTVDGDLVVQKAGWAWGFPLWGKGNSWSKFAWIAD